jgi:hypothetical protein
MMNCADAMRWQIVRLSDVRTKFGAMSVLSAAPLRIISANYMYSKSKNDVSKGTKGAQAKTNISFLSSLVLSISCVPF